MTPTLTLSVAPPPVPPGLLVGVPPEPQAANIIAIAAAPATALKEARIRSPST
jgi:hypothetical protein